MDHAACSQGVNKMPLLQLVHGNPGERGDRRVSKSNEPQNPLVLHLPRHGNLFLERLPGLARHSQFVVEATDAAKPPVLFLQVPDRTHEGRQLGDRFSRVLRLFRIALSLRNPKHER